MVNAGQNGSEQAGGIGLFFTNLGRVVAWVVFVLAAIRLAMGFVLALTAEDRATAARLYLGSDTIGEAINHGFYWLGIAIALGVLTEISGNIRSGNTAK